MAGEADNISMALASGGSGDALAQIFKHNDVAYYWSVKEKKTKRVRIERYSESQPGKIHITGGITPMDSGVLFTSREKAEEKNRQLAPGSPSKKARFEDGADVASVAEEEKNRQLAPGSPSKKARSEDGADVASVAAASGAEMVDADAAPARGLREGLGTDLASALEAKEAEAIAFARRTADWLDQLQSGNARGSLPVALAERFPRDTTTRAKMLAAVPWDSNHGYTTMLRYPKSSRCKGVLHIACFDYSERGLHGRGLYAGVDAISWLRVGDASSLLNMKRIDVVPVLAPGSNVLASGSNVLASGDTGGEPLSMFGYGSDGSMINATMVFALASVVLCSIDDSVTLPELWQAAAGAINVQYTKYNSGMDRLVSNMVSSNLNAKVNRSMDDPLLLASELGRQGMTSIREIRDVMKAYKARIMGATNLALKRTTEEVTVRLMDRSKFCENAINMLSRITQASGWQSGPISQESIAAPKLVINAPLVDSMNPTWSMFAIQTAASQTLLLGHIETRMIESQAERCSMSRYTKDAMDNLAVCVGLWHQIVTKIVPSMMLPEEKVMNLQSLAFEDESLQSSLLMLASGSCGEPPDVTDVSDFAPYILRHIAVLKLLQADHRREVRAVADSHPQAAITKQEMDSLTTGIYCAEVALDANRYRVAHSKALVRATENEDERATSMRLHIANVKQAQEFLSRVDMVLTQGSMSHTEAGSASFNSPSKLASGSNTRSQDPQLTCLAIAVGKASMNRHALLTAAGVSPDMAAEKVAILNVVQLHTQGMLKRKTLMAIKCNFLNGNLPGPILIMYPQISSGSYKSERVAFVSQKSQPQHHDHDSSASGDETSENDENDSDSLPEVMTKGVRTTSHWDGKVALASDYFIIEQILGQHDYDRYYPQQVTFVHTPGGNGNHKERKRIEKGLLLIPRTEPSPPSSASGDIAAEGGHA